MRTKTLVITAAVGALGTAAAMAQVYSVNAVGYVNVVLKQRLQIVANPLDAGAGNNTIAKLFNGVPDGTLIYKYTYGNPGGFVGYSYDLGWGSNAETDTLMPGEGAFVIIPTGLPDVTITFVGEVAQGAASNMDLKKGLQLVGSKVPQAGKIEADLKYPVADGDLIYKWQYATQDYKGYSYDLGWGEEPNIAVAEGIWVVKNNDAAWTRNFSVNQ